MISQFAYGVVVSVCVTVAMIIIKKSFLFYSIQSDRVGKFPVEIKKQKM